MSIRRALRSTLKYTTGGVAVAGLAWGGYTVADSERRRSAFYRFDGTVRYVRSVSTTILIGLDYTWNHWKATSERSPWRFEGTEEEEKQYLQEVYDEVHHRTAERLLRLICTNGGIYIKGGQYIAAQNHAFPKIVCSALKVLQDKAPHRPIEEVYEVLQEEFGQDPHEVFGYFDEKPLAAASLSQVHRGRTKDGIEVVVKVMYQGLHDRFESDMTTFRAIGDISAFFFPQFDNRWVYDEIYKHLVREMDFQREAANAKRAEKSWEKKYTYSAFVEGKRTTVRNVAVPFVYDDLTTKRVLTMEFIDGCKISDFDKIEKMGLKVADISRLMMNAFADQIFIHGFFHADPHPGNVFVRKNEAGGPQLVVLDHGLYSELNDEFRLLFCRLWKAMVMKDEATVKEVSAAMGVREYRLFAMMLMFRDFDTASIGMTSKIRADEFERMRDMVMEQVDVVMDMMRAMPKELLTVLRNNNYLRSINMDMGAPVNRFRIFASAAVEGLEARNEQNSSPFAIENLGHFLPRPGMFDKLRFHAFLEYHNVIGWLTEKWFRVMLYFGLLPPIGMKQFEEFVKKNSTSGEMMNAA